MPDKNRQWTMAARPVGYPKTSDFKLVESGIPEPRHGEVLVRTIWLSIDPYMRGRMGAAMKVGDVLIGEVVGRVEKSESSDFKRGDIVQAHIGWQEWGVAPAHRVTRVNTSRGPISTAIGVIGMPGLTAYFGLLDVCHPRPGETVVVSAASGPVGATVGQIAKINGCKVIGIAGSPDKVGYVTKELGFDGGINYKTENVSQRLKELCPAGVDVYFDNVGGPVTDAVWENLAMYARIVLCGQISQYNLAKPEMGPRNLRLIHGSRSRVQGFTVSQYPDRFEEGRTRLSQWVKSGQLKYREDVVEGIENAPEAMIGQQQGQNFGKLLVKVSDE